MDNNFDHNNTYQQNTSQQTTVSQQPVVVNELETNKDMYAITSLILGILGLVFSWCSFIPLIICIIGIVLGIKGMVKTKQHTGIALAGVITSAIGLALGSIFIILFFLV
jgi:small-conductance mechanosensitive channel